MINRSVRGWAGLGLLLLALCSGLVAAKSSEPTVLFLFTEKCWATFFEEFDFTNVECLKSLISKGLGLAIILGSFLLKAPQIFNIVKSKSGSGLSLSSLYFDVMAFICPSVYGFRQGFPFLSYGESIVILVQNIIIVLLVWMYTKEVTTGHKLKVFVLISAAIGGAFALPSGYLQLLPSIAIVLTIASRVPQVYANYSSGGTGVASSITWLLNFVGAVVRVFTTFNETGDMFQIAGFAIGASFSGMILLQILYYNSRKPAHKAHSA